MANLTRVEFEDFRRQIDAILSRTLWFAFKQGPDTFVSGFLVKARAAFDEDAGTAILSLRTEGDTAFTFQSVSQLELDVQGTKEDGMPFLALLTIRQHETELSGTRAWFVTVVALLTHEPTAEELAALPI